jgi:hypothetical protein
MGRARRFVVGLAVSLAVAGVLVCLLGIVRLAGGHSPAASSSLLLFGFLASVLPLALLPTIRRRYQEIELRAMRAHDVA